MSILAVLTHLSTFSNSGRESEDGHCVTSKLQRRWIKHKITRSENKRGGRCFIVPMRRQSQRDACQRSYAHLYLLVVDLGFDISHFLRTQHQICIQCERLKCLWLFGCWVLIMFLWSSCWKNCPLVSAQYKPPISYFRTLTAATHSQPNYIQ